MSENNPSSPNRLELRGSPIASARLSRNAALGAIGVMALILGVIVANISDNEPKQAQSNEATPVQLQPALGDADELPRGVPDLQAAPPPTASGAATVAAAPEINIEDEARLADTALGSFAPARSTVAPVARTDRPSELAAGGSAPGDRAAPGEMASLVDAAGRNEVDVNQQARKETFLKQTLPTARLNSQLVAPVSPYEIKTGTVIPSILISEINSDLPGEIIAQVSQNVYDTSSGNHLLIPQGTKLFGRYDSQVAFGQERLQVAWQRLIYPDASTIELGGMPGHDQGGKAGFADRVNNRYGRLFGFAILTSTLSAAAQLSQPRQDSAFDLPNDGQVVAGAVGQQMAELGIEIARRNLRVQPTIEVRKGYRLNVMVNQDVVFPGSYQF